MDKKGSTASGGSDAAAKCEALRRDEKWLAATDCFEAIGKFADAHDCCMLAVKDIPYDNRQRQLELFDRAVSLAKRAKDARKCAQALDQAAQLCESWSFQLESATVGSGADMAKRANNYHLNAGEAFLEAGERLDLISAGEQFYTIGLYDRTIKIVSRVVPQDHPVMNLLFMAYDAAGKQAAKGSPRDCGEAAQYWAEAARLDKLLGNSTAYLPPRCATLTVTAETAELCVTGRPSEQFDPEVDKPFTAELTARITEPSGRLANCAVKFKLLKAMGRVTKSAPRTDKDGIARTTLIVTGKAGPCEIKVRDNTGATTTLTVMVKAAAASDTSVKLQELRWIWPNSLGLVRIVTNAVGMKDVEAVPPEEPHWRDSGSKPIAHVFGGRGLNGSGRKDKKGLELDLKFQLQLGKNPSRVARLRAQGTATISSHADSPRVLGSTTLVFAGEWGGGTLLPVLPTPGGEVELQTAPQKHMRVFSPGCLPLELGHYDVKIKWRFWVRETDNLPWQEVGGTVTTQNDLYVTWRQPLPAVEIPFVATSTTSIGNIKGTPLYVSGGDRRWYPQVYLNCLESGTRAVVDGAPLDPAYLGAELAADSVERYELQILDRLFHLICEIPPWDSYVRNQNLLSNAPLTSSADNCSRDVLEHGRGNCGDWGCTLHDFAAAQGIHLGLTGLGDGWNGENFCMYAGAASSGITILCETSNSLLPAVYDAFIPRPQTAANPNAEYGLKSTTDRKIFGNTGGYGAYRNYLGSSLEFRQKWNSTSIRDCSVCSAHWFDYRDPETGHEITLCPHCGGALKPRPGE
jgi:hypothetical protein